MKLNNSDYNNTKECNEKNECLNELKPAFDELSDFLISNNIKFQDAVQLLRHSYISTAEKKHNCDTAARISLKTGIDRRNITPPTKKNNSHEQNIGKFKTDPIAMILTELRKYSDKHDTNLIDVETFAFITNSSLGRSTIPTVINELIELGCVLEVGNKKLKILSTSRMKTLNKVENFKRVGVQVSRMINTINNNSQNSNYKLLEWRVDSTKINSKNKKRLSEDLRQLRDHIRKDVLNFVDQYESNVKPNTFEPFSINIFINNSI